PVPDAGVFRESVMRHRLSRRVLATVSLVALLASGAGGCASLRSGDVTGSIARTDTPQTDADWRNSADVYGERYRANPRDVEAALRYGQALRMSGQRQQAVA